MSVLIEALTLVVPKRVLDVSYPGGTDAYLRELLHLERPPRFVCNGDPALVNISFYDPPHVAPAQEMLRRYGIVEVDDRRFVEMAIVDQRFGPTMPCHWLEWRRHAEGFTYAWLAGTDPGDMAAPRDWAPETAWSAMLAVVRRALDERGIPYSATEECAVTASLGTEHGDLELYLSAYDELDQVHLELWLPSRVPRERRAAMAEALARANHSMTLGAFDLDFESGELRYRAGIDVEGSALVPAMLHNMLDHGMAVVKLYHPALARVGWGGADPAAAIAEVEGDGEGRT